MIEQNLLKRFVYATVAIIVTVIIIAAAYHLLVFRVTKTTPNPLEFPTITPHIDIYFSKDVKSIGDFIFNGEKDAGKIDINGNRIRFTFSNSYNDGYEYKLVLTDIKSSSGDNMDYTYAFTAKYMRYSDVPDDIQKASIEKSSSGQVDDPFFNNYFPMQTSDFQIEHPRNQDNQREVLVVTFLKEVFNYDTNTRVTVSDEEAEELRKKTLDYIRSRGGTPEKYNISYDNAYLEAKYGHHED